MTTIRARLASAVSIRQSRSASWIPKSIRIQLRRLSGGDSSVSELVRSFTWSYRYFIVLSLLANLVAAVLEASTMVTINAVLLFLADTNALDANRYFAPILQSLQAYFGQSNVLQILLIIAVLMQIGRAWFLYLGEWAIAYLQAALEGDLRRQLFTQFTTMSYSDIAKYKAGDLASFMGEVTHVGHLIARTGKFLRDLMATVALAAVLLVISWQMTLFAVVSLLILSFSIRRIRQRIRRVSKQFLDTYVTMNSQVVEFLGGMRLLHTFGRQAYAREHVDLQIMDGVRSMRRHLRLTALVPAIIQTVTVASVALLLIGGYWWVQQLGGKQEMIASLVTFVFVIFRILPRFTMLNNNLALANQEIPVIQRVADQLHHNDKTFLEMGYVAYSGLKQAIVFDNVTMCYAGTSQPAIYNLNLTIERGKMIAFVGASGSGKSTIVSLLLRLYHKTDGEILIDGTKLSELLREDWLHQIGVVDQDTFVLHDTIAENIRFGRLDATNSEVKAAAITANAHEFITMLSEGYDTLVGDRGHKLSGGQRQRLAIARAVLRDPDILILDEATSALDSKAERLIQDAVDRLRADRTLIVIAHRLSTIAKADQIVVLHEGQIVESGTHDELLAINGRYKSMWSLQTRE